METPWIEHDGGGRPHPPMTYVEVQFRDGTLDRATSGFLFWPWDNEDYDVVRWRIVPKPPTKDEIIAELLEALRAVVDGISNEGVRLYASDAQVQAARAAIARAGGAS